MQRVASGQETEGRGCRDGRGKASCATYSTNGWPLRGGVEPGEPVWSSAFADCDLVVFVVDATDHMHISAATIFLLELLGQ